MKSQREKIHQLYDVIYNVDKVYESYAKSKGIVYNKMLFFYILLDENIDYMTQSHICEELDIPKTTLNSMIKNLLNRELITLTVNEKIKKKSLLC